MCDSKFVAEIETDNAAFEDGNRNLEVARILRVLAEQIENGSDGVTLRDINGNRVGFAEFDSKD
jgi:hypothetical protein